MNPAADAVRQERLRRGWSVRTAAAASHGRLSNTWWGDQWPVIERFFGKKPGTLARMAARYYTEMAEATMRSARLGNEQFASAAEGGGDRIRPASRGRRVNRPTGAPEGQDD